MKLFVETDLDRSQIVVPAAQRHAACTEGWIALGHE
jgi:hypothetical protein